MLAKKITGAALVEFALVLPFLTVLALGIIEFSYAFSKQNTLNKATHLAARYFSDPLYARQYGKLAYPIDVSSANTNTAYVRNFIKEFENLSNIVTTDNCSNLSTPGICIADLSSTYPNHIKITTVYAHEFITSQALSDILSLLVSGNVSIGPTLTLTASSVMRVQ